MLDEITLNTGVLTVEQLSYLLKYIPLDVSYVDENDIVRFYNESDHRIFPRDIEVIGMNVVECHPEKSRAMVQEIVDKFKKGEEDHAEFWINKNNIFIHMNYKAIRDEHGNYKGIIETMQECSRIRSLQGERKILVWDKEKEIIDNTTIENIDIVLNEDTKLQDLLKIYPQLKNDLIKISPAFKILNTVFGKMMASKATIKNMSERSNVDLNTLIEELYKLFKEYEKKDITN